MLALLTIIFWVLAIACGAFVVLRYLSGKQDLFTLCSIFLAGLIFFQLINAPPAIAGNLVADYRVSDGIPAGQIYAFWCVIFVVLFLFTYSSGFIAKPLAGAFRPPRETLSDAALWLLAPACLGLGAVLKFLVAIPFVGALSSVLGLALASVAAGMVAWLVVRNIGNPIAWVWLVGVTSGSMLVASIGEFSRRPLLSVMIALLWGAYYGKYRYFTPLWLLPRVVVLGMIGVIFVGLFTTGGRDLSGLSQATDISAVGDAIGSVTETYGNTATSIWLIDANYIKGRDFRVTPLQSITYIVMLPIPRILWRTFFGIEKPYTVSTYAADWAGRRGVRLGRSGVTNPAGIIGNPAAEGLGGGVLGGTIALVCYAIFFAIMIRFFDEILLKAPHEPLIALSIASVAGNVYGMPRGETANFAFAVIFGSFSSMFMLVMAKKLLAKLGLAEQNVFDYEDVHDADDPYEGYEDYESEAGEHEELPAEYDAPPDGEADQSTPTRSDP